MNHIGPKLIVLSPPRCGSTWICNWLTTDHFICLHSPIGYEFRAENIIDFNPGYNWGISDPTLLFYPEIVEKCIELYNTKVLIIERDLLSINKSLQELNFPLLDEKVYNKLINIPGPKCKFEELFNSIKARQIWKWLRDDLEFNDDRHKLLSNMNIQPNWDKIKIDTSLFLSNTKENLEHQILKLLKEKE